MTRQRHQPAFRIPPPALSFGIEQEFFIADLRSRNIVRRRPRRFFQACQQAFGEQITTELLQSQVELVTPILDNVASARDCLLETRASLGAIAEDFGLGILASGTHPLALWREQEATREPHYEQLFGNFQIVAQRNLLCGLHIHVGVPDGVDRIQVMNRVMPWLPLLLALSSSSPFWERKRTGLMSYRQAAYDEWPRTGIPDHFSSERAYRRYVELLVHTGSVTSDSDIWWAIRPSVRYPTLELRITDACPVVEDVLCIAALFRAMVHQAVTSASGIDRHKEMTRLVIDENRWRAKRFGTEATFLDPDSKRNVAIAQWLDMAEARFGESLDARDDGAAMARARSILDQGSSAALQLRRYDAARRYGQARRQALALVVDELMEVSRRGGYA
jgi:carboxylate-amine ligase